MKLKLTFFKLFLFIQLVSSCQSKVSTQETARIKYSDYVEKLETGTLNIDYANFRQSLLNDNEYTTVIARKREMDSLAFLLKNALEAKDNIKAISLGKQLLSIDYTNMAVHGFIKEAYRNVQDAANESKHATIQEGLMNSILQSGTGTSCKDGWVVTQVTEQGYILRTLGGNIVDMETDKNALCDKFVVSYNGNTKEYFFKRLSDKVQ